VSPGLNENDVFLRVNGLDLAIATVKRIMRDLKSDGSLKREGSDKTGRWIVIRTDEKKPSRLNANNKN
jgi:hypothetical protein